MKKRTELNLSFRPLSNGLMIIAKDLYESIKAYKK